MILDIIIAGSCGGAGICCGWVMHALQRAGGPTADNQSHTTDIDSPRGAASESAKSEKGKNSKHPAEPSLSPAKVASVADRIRALASIVAANVDEHQTKVDQVNGVLSTSDLSGAPPEILDAVGQLLAANETMRAQLEDSQERLREQSKQLESAEQRAETDALTELANRGAFDKRLDRQYAKGPAGAGVLAILDIDFFKRFNDEHGHRIGDEVLRSVARMLEARLQPYGLVARFGGEEFCVMIDNIDYDEAIDLIEKTRVAVSNREIRFEGKRLKVTMSVGIGVLQPEQSSDDWLQRVDDALYRSKEVGRNCAHYLDDDKIVKVASVEKLNPHTLASMTDEIAKVGNESQPTVSTSAPQPQTTASTQAIVPGSPVATPPAVADQTNAANTNAIAADSQSPAPADSSASPPVTANESNVPSVSKLPSAADSPQTPIAAKPAASEPNAPKTPTGKPTDDPGEVATPVERTLVASDPLVAAIASDVQAVEESVASVVDKRDVEPEEDAETQQLKKLTSTLCTAVDTERPKGLTYLPDRDTMIDGILDALDEHTGSNRSNRLMAVTLSGQPGGSTMRSVLQLVRAAMRSQDRIGCLNHSTLLVSMPECEESEALLRAKQICSSAPSVGLTLASADKAATGERLSIGILGMTDVPANQAGKSRIGASSATASTINHAIAKTQAIAMLGGRLCGSGENAKPPILSRNCSMSQLAEIAASR
ncbi:GGDEF domain-containing protein [Rhodopirellula sallentina]|uniref:diguanylate cyclase n=1 Tax=Rhodopirellula sallentina SM41 TaxID=1263870 RepID=M5U5L4_9BACT|nr:GGDEF domain-containing protein [Rhodopirellula sallentina]EMI53156.1 Diguanylate cyclase, predicted domain protein [Rhodopirellula sallentina SM41]